MDCIHAYSHVPPVYDQCLKLWFNIRDGITHIHTYTYMDIYIYTHIWTYTYTCYLAHSPQGLFSAQLITSTTYCKLSIILNDLYLQIFFIIFPIINRNPLCRSQLSSWEETGELETDPRLSAECGGRPSLRRPSQRSPFRLLVILTGG